VYDLNESGAFGNPDQRTESSMIEVSLATQSPTSWPTPASMPSVIHW
jgi:hypothetical protein